MRVHTVIVVNNLNFVGSIGWTSGLENKFERNLIWEYLKQSELNAAIVMNMLRFFLKLKWTYGGSCHTRPRRIEWQSLGWI